MIESFELIWDRAVMLIKLENVTVHYGTAEAIKDINILQDKGSVVSVIGANGAGKSTILKSISGLVALTAGSIEFSGEKINGMSVDRIVNLGIAHIPEGRRLFPYMSVAENIHLGAYLRKDKAGISTDLEKVFGLFPILKERRNQKAGSLSGGEQQMLAIGRALMAKPVLLMMDEPSLGLAPIVIDNLADTIIDINKSGITVLLVEQNAGLVTKVSQKCYVMEVGKVVLEGNIKDLMADDSVRRAFLG
jgi:branched-chain amino acid transport system ATP-binding protein